MRYDARCKYGSHATHPGNEILCDLIFYIITSCYNIFNVSLTKPMNGVKTRMSQTAATPTLALTTQ